jgi:methylated-DNA-[protein]-cysteine S-methyltransferase
MMQFCEVSTPIGKLTVAGDEEGLRGISFPRSAYSIPRLSDWRHNPEPFREAIRQLEAYFAGELSRFDLRLAPAGTPFQREVWAVLQKIPYGETTSYGEIARMLGNANAFRAVGAANGRNPIPIVIPCHRVIGSDGSLTGFGGGLSTKSQLLALEARHRAALEGRSLKGAWKRTAAGSPSAR